MGTGNLSISESLKDGILILSLTGDLDAHTSPQMKDTIEKAIAEGKTRIVFDFSSLKYISSAGIGILNATLNQIKSKNGKMAIAAANETIRDTLEIMYFHKKTAMYLNVNDAVKNV